MADEAGAQGTQTSDDGLVETVRRVVAETIDELLGSGKADVQDKDDAGGKPAGDPESKTWTPREIQEFAAAEMRRVQDELKAKRKAAPRRQEQPAAGSHQAPGSGAGDGTSNALPPPAPTNPKSWRNKLWGTP